MLGVVRLQLINTQSLVWVPLIVLAGAVVISLIIIGLIPGDDVKVVGAANAPLWYFVALGVQSMTLAFPFSQAMSVTRREFFSGTLVLGAIASAMMASIFLILAGIEALTDGFWMNGRIAYLPYLFESGWVDAWLSYFTATLFLFVIGFWMATIWKRFGTLAVVSIGVGLGLVITIAIFLITKMEWWVPVITWFGDIGVIGVTLGGLVLTAALALGSYATLRRATV
jgi:hypothetical protein